MSMLSKIGHIICLILFVLFAVVQYNDSDGFKWIILYLLVALLPLLRIMGKSIKLYSGFLIGLFMAFIVLRYNLLTEWLEAGKPAFIDYEPTNIKEVEGIREFLGICICLSTSITYSILNRKGLNK